MKNTYEHVLQPIQLGPMKLKNRVSFTPVWPSFATADGHVNRELMEWTRDIVKGDCACINIGCGIVNRNLPKEVAHLLRLGEESVVNELSMLCDLVHMYDCKIGMELFAINMEAGSFENRDTHASKPTVEIDPTYLTKDQIHGFIEDFATAAERAMRAGVDSILIHGAHGQLPGCFLSKLINERTDEYGAQSIENSARFTNELLQAIRDKVGNKVAIEYRINANDMIPGSPSLEEVIAFVKVIEDKIDLLHVSRGMHSIQALAPYINQPVYFDHGINIEDAAKIKAEVDVPVTVVGSVTLEQAEKAIAEHKIDMVSIARGLMADPMMVKNARFGQAQKTRPCVRCNNCIQKTHYLLAPLRCSVNAEMGMETLYAGIPAPGVQKRVAIIGGGPGGMEAARTAAQRNHKVVLFEKSNRLGGVLNMASIADFKADMKTYLDWAVRETEAMPNIEIRKNVTVTPELLAKDAFDVVIVAVGANPLIPAFAQKNDKIQWVGDVEMGTAETGKNVVIVGAGLTGCEAALSQKKKGKHVVLVDMVPQEKFGNGGAKFNQIAIINMLKDAKVIFRGGLRLESVEDKEATFINEEGNKETLACDTVVLSLGVRPDADYVETFQDCAPEVLAVGDCNTRQGTLYNAIHTAHEAAYLL
ncbi:NAD(P)/FAD-dependent oxidoreductase [uncultured Sphaerochaeta sp.]|uniref:NAD(P)/FAD-dependent oxidoreductase n=1 Tax=uncultured Sphaerochaeta sp. TaxID=886478 RepID=UPI002A0A80BC|nr:NAD(P)/FAD-dependent oxidoreductase [uncultured Sphaerochaeta sp.]